MRALVAAGGKVINDEDGQFTVPAEIVAEGLATGLLVHCDEHDAPEIADGVTPEQVETWLAARGRNTTGPVTSA